MSYGIPGPELSDVPVELMIDEYGGEVESQFAKRSIMREFVNVRGVRGTDTIVNNRVGRTTLQKLTPGVRPPSNYTPFGKVTLTVDTVILARDQRSMLNEFQTHFDARIELAEDHGKEVSKLFDQAFLIMAIKGALAPAPVLGDGNPAKQSIGAGKNVTLDAAGDEDDPDKLAQAITDIITQMEEEEIDVEDLVVLVRPTRFQTLLNNNKLMNRDYGSGNGDYSKGNIYEINGARIVKTARIPEFEIEDHPMSNDTNGYAYDITGTQANAVAVVLHPKSLMAGETIPLTSDVYFDKLEKSWFIDSWLAFAVTVNRPDCCGAVFKVAA
ncbi:major head protein [Agrobacterium phage Atu_ph03]|uniref:Capsid and scaffold protein n=2 Tax=Atuphduovirus TaxID=2731928 RepID=A0A223W0E2_9CAUD|nr:major head protein [Agrobacterium phage Atu_ph02]YP_009791872.1 major head protein [Agrobacterium phage Atu_ph03]ASV44567.1 capsid and scaffold protein [Agrobacterium phage Atu_ph02]ASV44583.1 capsid and scaffold protein [Agrobacterium phage Atu_ph03]